MDSQKLALSLAAMRLSLGVFLLVWAFMKVLAPENAIRVAAGFYGIETGETAILIVGLLQIAFIFAFIAGVFKTVTYGGVLVFHIVSVLSTWARLIEPYSAPNGLFWAAVPLVVMFAVLFVFRKQDIFLTVNRRSET